MTETFSRSYLFEIAERGHKNRLLQLAHRIKDDFFKALQTEMDEKHTTWIKEYDIDFHEQSYVYQKLHEIFPDVHIRIRGGLTMEKNVHPKSTVFIDISPYASV